MRLDVWCPPVEPSPAEQQVVEAVRWVKLFVFLRGCRRGLFDERFPAGLAAMRVDSARSQPPTPPAQLALVTVLQADTGVSGDEVVEATVMDRRWQLVLGCVGADRSPFSESLFENSWRGIACNAS